METEKGLSKAQRTSSEEQDQLRRNVKKHKRCVDTTTEPDQEDDSYTEHDGMATDPSPRQGKSFVDVSTR